MNRSLHLLRIAGVTLVATCAAAPPQGPQASEVKAAFLFNFTKFVEWPEGALGPRAAPLTICVAAGDHLASTMEQVMKGKVLSGRPLHLRRLRHPAEAHFCNVIFLDGESERRLGRVLGAVRDFAILTVGDSETFLRSGGIIRLVERDRRMTFEINIDAAARADLQISSRLLALGTTVTDAYARTR